MIVEIPTGGFGSGVIIDNQHVLTAYHVVDGAPDTIYMVHLTSGKIRMMVRDKDVKEHDVASLKFLNPAERFEGVKYPTWGPVPQVGERLILISGGPDRNVRDGLIEGPDSHTGPGKDVKTSTIIEPGNSGSGLYDLQGRLVAVTTRYFTCQNSQICGGRGASVLQYERFFLHQ